MVALPYSRSSPVGVLELDTLVVTLPDACHAKIIARTGWPIVSILCEIVLLSAVGPLIGLLLG